MMKNRNRSTGYRQKAWTALRKSEFASVAALADHIKCSPDGLRAYVAGLEAHGYVQRGNLGQLTLARNTGARAPSWSVHTGNLRDWNLEPSMTASQLRTAIKKSGMTVVEWLRAHGKHEAGATRLRQMMNGQRPVSPEIEAAATE